MKKSICLLFSLILILTSTFADTITKNQSYPTLEGKGADSPEEAVSNYLKALQSCDYNKIISCYAIESFVENYNVDLYIEHMNLAPVTMSMIYPENKLLEQTGKYEVLSEITKVVKYQIWNLCKNDFFKKGNIIMNKGNPSEVINQTFPENAEKRLQNINFLNFLSVDEVLTFYVGSPYAYNSLEEVNEYKAAIIKSYEKNKKIYGCSNVQDVTAAFSIGEDKYYYFAETLQYGNKWYISPKQGFCSSLIGLFLSAGSVADIYELGWNNFEANTNSEAAYVISRDGSKVTAKLGDEELTDFSMIDQTDPTEVLAAFFISYFNQTEDWKKYVSPQFHEIRIEDIEEDWEEFYSLTDFISISFSPDDFDADTGYYSVNFNGSYQGEDFDDEDEVSLYQDTRTHLWYISELPR